MTGSIGVSAEAASGQWVRCSSTNCFRPSVQQKASDLHLTVGSQPMLRLHGHMRPLATKVLEPADTVSLMKSITPERCQQELQEVGGTDFGFAFGDMARFRVAVFKQRGNVGLVLRRIPNEFLTFEQLGLPPVIEELIKRPRGLDPGDGADRLGQDDEPGVDDQLHQQHDGPPHHHHRRPDRVFPQAQQVADQSARDRHRRTRLSRSDPPCPANGPRHHPGR